MKEINSSIPKVVHCKRASYDIYIGRANDALPQSKWANPWVIGKDGTRDEVIARYAEWIKTQPDLIKSLPELRGKTLGCWCRPENKCHGDILAQMVEEEIKKEKKEEIVIIKQSEVNKIESEKQEKRREFKWKEDAPLPLFSSHYSIGESILTLDEAGKTKAGNAVSICDIAKEYNLSRVIINDNRIDGYIEAFKNIESAKIAQLIYGVTFVICDDLTIKDDASERNESKVIIFMNNKEAYPDLLKIWNKAWVDGKYKDVGRIDWKMLKSLWTSNLTLAFPFFSSFLSKNLLTLASIVPDFPVEMDEIIFLREIDSDLPFASLIDTALNEFSESQKRPINIFPCKTIYYFDENAFDSYTTFRAIQERGQFSRPKVNHLCSDKFSFQSWKQLAEEPVK